MKITATKDFGNTKNNKVVLPLVPEPTETVTKKEDLATVDLYSDPTDTDSTKVRFAFKTLNGTAESPRDLIDWRKNVERAFTGLNSTTGLLQHQMMQQFCRGTTLSTYNSNVNQLYRWLPTSGLRPSLQPATIHNENIVQNTMQNTGRQPT